MVHFFNDLNVKDSVLIGTEHMQNNTMFTVSEHFRNLNTIVDSLRSEHRAAILQLVMFYFVDDLKFSKI